MLDEKGVPFGSENGDVVMLAETLAVIGHPLHYLAMQQNRRQNLKVYLVLGEGVLKVYTVGMNINSLLVDSNDMIEICRSMC